MIEKIKLAWDKLPKEVKVSAYIAVSYGLAELIKIISQIQVDNTYLAITINIFLVFLKELKPRIERMK